LNREGTKSTKVRRSSSSTAFPEGGAETMTRDWAGADPITPDLEQASHRIIGAAIEVHRHLGPGFLESVYEKALVYELRLRGLTVQQQAPVKVQYKDLEIAGQRLDVLVEPGIVVELKAVDQLLPIHEAQLLGYLKATGNRLGLLLNFRGGTMKEGIRRIIL
jgi:GxxExxY protein